jgi:hypothetical protein
MSQRTGNSGRRVQLPPGYSAGTKGNGHTFTWRDDASQWRSATAEMGAPWPTLEAMEKAAAEHCAARKGGRS